MATIAINSVCAGGDHINITMASGQTRTETISRQDLRREVQDVSKRELIAAQLASLIRANPNATHNQLRNIIQSYTFLE